MSSDIVLVLSSTLYFPIGVLAFKVRQEYLQLQETWESTYVFNK